MGKTIDSAGYIQHFFPILLEFWQFCCGDDEDQLVTIIHDNAPIHQSKHTQAVFTQHGIPLMQ